MSETLDIDILDMDMIHICNVTEWLVLILSQAKVFFFYLLMKMMKCNNQGNWLLQCSMIHAIIQLETEQPGRTEKQQAEPVYRCLETSKTYYLL